jgi:hypothetical protein
MVKRDRLTRHRQVGKCAARATGRASDEPFPAMVATIAPCSWSYAEQQAKDNPANCFIFCSVIPFPFQVLGKKEKQEGNQLIMEKGRKINEGSPQGC